VATAGVGAGDPVLEVGCGTGQLTGQLVPFGFALAAIDIGPSMVAKARRRLGPAAVDLRVTAFEDLDVPAASYGLVVSATAFHWIDPDVGWAKAAHLLRPGGWLAVLGTREVYDEPVGPAVRDLYVRHGDGGAWVTAAPSPADTLAATGLFEPAVVRTASERDALPAETVFGLEHTRATTLAFDEGVRAAFGAGLRALLDGRASVGLERQTLLTMARVRPS
jgi:SAM-dependent methyltransferase